MAEVRAAISARRCAGAIAPLLMGTAAGSGGGGGIGGVGSAGWGAELPAALGQVGSAAAAATGTSHIMSSVQAGKNAPEI
jgi:hypothetical protein